MICEICKKQYKSFGSLAQHITRKHKWTTQKYYDLYFKLNDKEGKCVCGKETRFINIKEGYVESCGNVCAGILKRKRLKENKEKYQKFIEKVSANQKAIWSQRELNDDKEKILKKAAEQNRIGIKKLNKEERQERFGWLNKLKGREKEKAINNIIKPLKKYYENFTPNDFIKKYKQRSKKMLGERYDQNVMRSFLLYRDKIRLLTERTYRKYKHIINPSNHKRSRTNGYQLDHKFSIVAGFKENIEPEIISSIYNLEILPRKVNSKKYTGCSISKDKLIELYKTKKNR